MCLPWKGHDNTFFTEKTTYIVSTNKRKKHHLPLLYYSGILRFYQFGGCEICVYIYITYIYETKMTRDQCGWEMSPDASGSSSSVSSTRTWPYNEDLCGIRRHGGKWQFFDPLLHGEMMLQTYQKNSCLAKVGQIDMVGFLIVLSFIDMLWLSK